MEEDGTFSSIPYDSDNEHFQKESWPPVDHPQLSNQKLAIVWEEEVQMNEVDSKEQPHALPPAGGLDDPEEAESQWGPIILPVYPMTHPSVALSFATVQWDMPVPSSQTPYPTVDNSLAELDSVSFLKPQDTDFTSEEDTQNDDGLAALQPLNSTVEEKGSVSQPCDMLNTEEETKQTTQEEEDPVWELPDCIDTDDGLAEISQADTEEEDGQSVTEEAVEPAETLLITEEGIVDSEPGEERQNVVDSRLDEEQERPDILLTGQTDLEQEPRSATVKSLKTEEQHLGRVEDENYNGEDETVTKIPCNEENEEPVSVVLKGPCEREQLGECSNHVGLIIKPDQSIHSEEFQKLTEGWRLRENTDLNNETIVEPLACEVVNQISNSEQIAEVLQHLTEICQEESEQNNQTENAYSVEPPSEQTRLCEETTAHSVEPQDSEPMHLENTEPSEQFQPSNWAELLNQTQYSNEYSNKSTEPELLDQSQHIEQREQSQQSEQLSKEEQSEQLERDNQPEQPQQPGKEELSEQPEKEGQIEESQQPEKEESREQPQQPGKEELPEQSQQPEKEGQTEQPQQPGKEELPEQSQQSEKEESTEQSQQPGKEGQTEQSQQSEKEGQTEQSQQSEKEGQTEQSQQPEKEEQPEESEQPEKEEQTEPSQQPEKEGQTEQSQQPEKEQQPEESEQPEKEGLQELSEQPETEEQTELSEKEERPEESEQPEKESQPEQSRQSEVIALMPHTAVIEHPVQTDGSQQSDQSLQTSSPSPTPSTPPGMQAETDRTGETNQAENKSPEVTEHVARTEFTQEERQTKNSPQNIQPDCRKGAPMQTVMSNGGPPELAGTLENETVVDREKASCLAERLYRLDGIQRKDVVRHLDKDNDFSRAVGEEYLKFFDFTGQTLDNALRSILKVVLLIGETQERERVLQHFACRFHQCNPHSFSDAETVLMLTCALMLLNSDLHGQNVGKAMSSSDFVSNLDGMDEGQNFSKELLKNFYSSIKNEPLEWAVDEEELKSSMLLEDDAKEDAPVRCKSNPFQDVPHNSKATVFKQGFLQRKTHADIDGKRTPWGKRSWKTFYGVLRGMVLYLHKDEYKKEYHSTEEVVSVHHGLAEQAINYTKKPHVFRLQTADWRVFLFQASSRAEMSSWINRMNLVSALHSSPPFPAAVGSQRRFCRPILPASQSAHTLERQLQSHAGMLESFQNDLTFLHQNLPEGRRAKAKELEEHRVREEYLQHEICRYEVYIRVLEAWKGLNMAADAIVGTKEFALFDKALSKDFMGDEDEEVGLKKSYSSPSLDLELAPPPLVKVKRNISERRTYRKTIIPRRNKIL